MIPYCEIFRVGGLVGGAHFSLVFVSLAKVRLLWTQLKTFRRHGKAVLRGAEQFPHTAGKHALIYSATVTALWGRRKMQGFSPNLIF